MVKYNKFIPRHHPEEDNNRKTKEISGTQYD